MELEPILENRQVLGVAIKYGEDRFLTRQIIKAGYLTTMTLDAVCRTTVPSTLSNYFSQQLRWRRSNIIDYVGGISHVWRLNPIIAIHFFALFGLLMVYPALVMKSIMAGTFFPLMTVHFLMAGGFGVLYRFQTRRRPADDKVSALAFIPIAFVMPVTYALLTPVALFTLDSGSWETRNHAETEPALEAAEPESERRVEAEPAVARAEMPAA
jgi:cellulose synthase/poly-beta-1,6-N-acetylglucosamine synthase-like glycosyltransferase